MFGFNEWIVIRIIQLFKDQSTDCFKDNMYLLKIAQAD